VDFDGHRELRLALAAAAQAANADGERAVGSDIGPRDSLSEVVKKITYADARAVEETGAQLQPASLGAVVDAVVKARRVDIYGVGASAFVAVDLQQKLYRIGYMVLTVVDCLLVAVAQRNYRQTMRALEQTYAAVQARR
jgi:DNA-binding MurR/RpiR family transcriptional regulator